MGSQIIPNNPPSPPPTPPQPTQDFCQLVPDPADNSTFVCDTWMSVTSVMPYGLYHADGTIKTEEEKANTKSSVWCASETERTGIGNSLFGTDFDCSAEGGGSTQYVKVRVLSIGASGWGGGGLPPPLFCLSV